MKKRNASRLAALALAALMAVSLAGCNKDADPGDTSAQGPGSSGGTQAPDGYVDNSIDIGEFKPEELIMADPDAGIVIGNMDEQIYWNGSGFNPKFAANALLTDQSRDADGKGLPLARFWDRIGGVNLGGKSYDITDLVRPRGEGFQVLEMLAKDFGVDRYDPETGALAECLGAGIEGDALREAYSERSDLEDYTVCVYYLHAKMSGLDEAEYGKAVKALEDKAGTDHDHILDGTLAVMLYYDTDGNDAYYAVVASAPGYFRDAEDYAANMTSGLRYDITNCNMLVDDRPVGFLNHVIILCDQDEVPSATVIYGKGSDGGAEGRIEDGDAGGTADVESPEESPAAAE